MTFDTYELDKFYPHQKIRDCVLDYEELQEIIYMTDYIPFDSLYFRLEREVLENKDSYEGNLEDLNKRIVNNYLLCQRAFELCKKTGITYGNLIRYIEQYPGNCSEEEEKKLETLLEENKISLLNTSDSPIIQIKGEDIYRIGIAYSRTYQELERINSMASKKETYLKEINTNDFLESVADSIQIPLAIKKEQKGKYYQIRKETIPAKK